MASGSGRRDNDGSEAVTTTAWMRVQAVLCSATVEHERAPQNPEIVFDDAWTAAIAWMREALASGPDAQRAHAVVRSLVQRLDVWSDKQGVTLHYYLGNVGGAASFGGTPVVCRQNSST